MWARMPCAGWLGPTAGRVRACTAVAPAAAAAVCETSTTVCAGLCNGCAVFGAAPAFVSRAGGPMRHAAQHPPQLLSARARVSRLTAPYLVTQTPLRLWGICHAAAHGCRLGVLRRATCVAADRSAVLGRERQGGS